MKVFEFAKKYRLEILIFLIAITLRLILFSALLHANQGNFIDTVKSSDGYYSISHNLLLGNGYSDSAVAPYAPNAMRPPVWIYFMTFIAWIFGSYVAVFIFEIIFASFIPIVAMYLAKRVISWRLSVVVGIFLAIEPNMVSYSIVFASEASFTLLFLLFTLFLFRYIEKETFRNVVLSGLFLGLAILIKPVVQFLPIFTSLFLLYVLRKKLSRQNLTHIACFAGICLLTITPWAYRNYQTFGAWGISNQTPLCLYSALIPTVLAIEKNTSFEAERNTIPLPNSILGKDITVANSGYITGKGLEILSQHKLALMKSMAISIVTFFTHDGILELERNLHISPRNFLTKPAIILAVTDPITMVKEIVRYSSTPGLFVLLGRLFWILFTIMFFIGTWIYYRKEGASPHALFSTLVIAYFALVMVVNGFGINARFRIPVNGFIAIFAFYGIVTLYNHLKIKLTSRNV